MPLASRVRAALFVPPLIHSWCGHWRGSFLPQERNAELQRLYEKERATSGAAIGELESRRRVRHRSALVHISHDQSFISVACSHSAHPCSGCACLIPQDKDEAEKRLARLQMEHKELTQRFLETKKREAERMNELNKLHEEANARSTAAALIAAADTLPLPNPALLMVRCARCATVHATRHETESLGHSVCVA